MGKARDMGRPSSYSDEIADEICNLIADGQSLRTICADDDMPNKATVFRWLAAHESFRDQYARARDAQADALVDEMIDIADAADADNAQAARLQVDARKWVASKLKPKLYGDKVQHDHDGAVQHNHAIDVSALNPDQLRALASIKLKENN